MSQVSMDDLQKRLDELEIWEDLAWEIYGLELVKLREDHRQLLGAHLGVDHGLYPLESNQ